MIERERPPADVGDEPPPRRRRLEPIRAYVENRGWIWVYELIDELDWL